MDGNEGKPAPDGAAAGEASGASPQGDPAHPDAPPSTQADETPAEPSAKPAPGTATASFPAPEPATKPGEATPDGPTPPSADDTSAPPPAATPTPGKTTASFPAPGATRPSEAQDASPPPGGPAPGGPASSTTKPEQAAPDSPIPPTANDTTATSAPTPGTTPAPGKATASFPAPGTAKPTEAQDPSPPAATASPAPGTTKPAEAQDPSPPPGAPTSDGPAAPAGDEANGATAPGKATASFPAPSAAKPGTPRDPTSPPGGPAPGRDQMAGTAASAGPGSAATPEDTSATPPESPPGAEGSQAGPTGTPGAPDGGDAGAPTSPPGSSAAPAGPTSAPGAATASFPAPGAAEPDGPTAPPPGQTGGVSTAAPEPPASPGPPAYGASRGSAEPIFDLPDEPEAASGGSGTLVLGGAAAAEGRTTGPTPRIGGPGPAGARHPGGNGDGDAAEGEDGPGRHFRPAGAGAGAGLAETLRSLPRPSWNLVAIAAPIAVVALLLGCWAVDTAALSGQVMRNVEVAGRPVGGLGEASLPDVMTEIGDELAARKVRIEADDKVYETTAGEIGLALDAEATSEAALDAGRSDSLLTRPFSWVASFFSPREVDVRYSVSQSDVEAKLFELQGTDLTAPHPPTVQLTDAGFVGVPGIPGSGLDTEDIVDQLPKVAAGTPDGTIVIETDMVEVQPPYTDEDAEALAARANEITANGIALTAGDATTQVDAATLRSWIGPTTANGNLDLAINADAVNGALPGLFAGVSADPVNAGFDLQNGAPVVVPSRPGVACCGANSAELVWQGVQDGQSPVPLEVQVTEPSFTTEQAAACGVAGPVGGSNAWRNGAPSTAGPGFTTYYDPGQPRVSNIHRIADLVRGAVIQPGGTFSVNGHVGPRTTDKGFVEAGAIRDGVHVEEVGGGVSQFATTTFNAAYFAGLDIVTYQAHTESFSRYPPGREATMGYPNPDLRIRNNTPYCVLIWTSYTANSVTVTMYSTPHASGEQTGISESMNGNCRVVTTTRTRTFPDGHTENDSFRAQYRPGEGQFC